MFWTVYNCVTGEPRQHLLTPGNKVNFRTCCVTRRSQDDCAFRSMSRVLTFLSFTAQLCRQSDVLDVHMQYLNSTFQVGF
jgi:hypothetical protein